VGESESKSERKEILESGGRGERGERREESAGERKRNKSESERGRE
jgi:hypothetical protein